MTRGLNKLSEKEWMDYTYGSEDEIVDKETINDEDEQLTSNEIITFFNTAEENKDKYIQVEKMIDNFDIKEQELLLKEKIFNIYENVVNEFLDVDPPSHILTTNKTKIMNEFVQSTFDFSSNGNEINALKEIQSILWQRRNNNIWTDARNKLR